MKMLQDKNRLLRSICLIFLCFVVFIFSNGQWSIPVFVWIYPILFLCVINYHRKLKAYFIIFAMYMSGFIIQFSDVIGMGILICSLIAALTAAFKVSAYILYSNYKRSFAATFLFAAAMVIAEYIIYCIYPILGGLSDAYTQYQNLLLIQFTTVFGIYGVIFIINWTAAAVVWFWGRRHEFDKVSKSLYIYLSIIGCVFVYNIFMLYQDTQGEKVRIASITVPVSQLLEEDRDVSAVFYSDSFTEENLSRAKIKLSKVHEELFDKTNKEANAGSKVVFWSELNGAVLKEDEQTLLKQVSAIAKYQKIYIIASLLVKTPYKALKENKTVAFNTAGELVSEYCKYGRSIGELCLKGDGKLKSLDTEYGRLAPFICSDMAFTSKINQAGRNAVDILIIPASDWKEMSPIAIKTAVIRGVENGCCVVRHTNKGLSIAADNKGNVLSLTDYFTSDTKTMVSQIPVSKRFTIYPYIGNIFVYLCVGYILLFLVYKKLLIKNVLFMHRFNISGQ